MISTKGRYSIRILLDLAEHGSSGGYTPMKEVAVRQEISLKYIERILPPLKNAGLIASTHGIGGGYRLTRPPEDYKRQRQPPASATGPDGGKASASGLRQRRLGAHEQHFRLHRSHGI